MSEAELAGLVARSLTGEDALPSGRPGADATQPARIADALRAAGWTTDRIAAVREAAIQAGHPGPSRYRLVTCAALSVPRSC